MPKRLTKRFQHLQPELNNQKSAFSDTSSTRRHWP